MRTRILALIIVAVMIFPTSFAAFAASEVEVTKVMFTDADKVAELSSLYDYSEGVGCSFSYQTSAQTSAYGMLMLKKSGKIVSSLEQTFSLAASGIATFDDVLVPDMTDAGVYEVVFMLFDSRENMQLIKGSNVKISCEVYPDEYDATNGLGLDFESESSKSKMLYYRASGTNDTASISISEDFAKNGNYSLAVPVLKSWDRVFAASTLSGGAIKNNLISLGNGKYRVCGYIYPASSAVTFSPRLVVKNSAVNSGKEYNFTTKVTAQPGKWSYFYADYDVEDYFSSTLTSARPQIQIETTMAAEQYIYIDDLKIVKLEEGLEEMTPAPNAVVKAQAEANQNVVVTAEGADTIYAVEAVSADENGVVEAQLSLSDGFESEDITINVYTKDKFSQKMAEGLVIEDVTYTDFRYFALHDINGVKINGITVNDEIMPYDEIVLTDGDINVTFDIKNSEDKKLRIVAASYNNGMFKSSAISEEGKNSILIEDVSAEDTLEFFLVDDKMTLTSHLYTLSQEGLTETEVYKSVAKFKSLPVANYNTVNSCIEFDANVDADSFVILAAYPSNKTEDDDYAYIGVKKLNKGSNPVSLCIDKDRYVESGIFELDYYTTSADVFGSLAPYDYVGEKELLGYYETLNNPESTTSDIYDAISSKALKIDMGYYNSLSSDSKAQTKVLQLFMDYNDKKDIVSAADVQNIFDEAVATVILSGTASVNAIEKLGGKIPLNKEFFADFKGEDIGFKEKIAALVTANAVSPENASKEKANELFEDAYLTAQLTYKAETYGTFMKMATETYADKINLDMSKVGSSNESDVFKYMFENRSDVENIADIQELYIEAIDDAEDDDDKGSSSSGSRRGGGGGSYVKPSVQTIVPEISQRTKFTDMEDNHWAIESVLFLNDIGVISDAASYRPDDCITREEVVKMLICSFGELDENANCDFSDIEKTAWCYPYIASAFKNGMVNGIDENTFGIGRNISRQDALVMIYRVVKDNLEEVVEDYVFEFSDVSSINDYAVDAVKALCANGIVNGYEDGTFRPTASISRAECAKLLTTVFRR